MKKQVNLGIQKPTIEDRVLDQPERAIFVVLTQIFDIVEPVFSCIKNPTKIGLSVALLLKFSDSIRGWIRDKAAKI
jgi:hypothetical protein